MKLNLIIVMLLALATAGLAKSHDSSKENSKDYRIISQRNIFNQHRVPTTPNSSSKPVKTVPRGTVDAFSLVGTLVYEKGSYAFFDGSNPSYRKVVQLSDVISDYKVVAIRSDSVQLEAGGRQFEMKVGAQLRRTDDTAQLINYSASTYSNAAPASSSYTPSSSYPPSSTAPLPGGASPSDVLKKLMEKRAQEMR